MSSTDYYNRLSLSVARGPMPDMPPTASFDLVIDEPDGGLGNDEVALLKELARELTLTADRVPAPHAIETRTSQLEWGASGGDASVLIYIAEALGAIGLEAMIRLAISRTQEIRRGPEQPLEEAAAASAAIQAITRRYDVIAADLERWGEYVAGDGHSWSLTYRSADDEYQVSVRSVAGYASITSVARTTLGRQD